MSLSSIVHKLVSNFSHMAKRSIKTFSAYASALSLAVAPVGCGSEEQEARRGCVTDNNCKNDRVCIDGLCRDARFYDPRPEEPRHEEIPSPRCVEQIDVCDGLDNNCNGIIDELGCGRVYIYNYTGLDSGPSGEGAAGPFGQFIYIDLSTFSRVELTSSSWFRLSGQGALSPDHAKFLYASEEELNILTLANETEYKINLLVPEESELCIGKMGSPVGIGHTSPWFPDGRRFSYTRLGGFCTVGGEDFHGFTTLHSIRVDGSDNELISLIGGHANIIRHSVSPNGEWIAFLSTPKDEFEIVDGKRRFSSGEYEVYVVRSDGREPRRLTYLEDSADYPRWIGNTTILYTTHVDDDNQKRRLYSVSLDGSNTRLELEYCGYPTFNTDYSKAIVMCERQGDTTTDVWDLATNQVFKIGSKLYALVKYQMDILAWTE